MLNWYVWNSGIVLARMGFLSTSRTCKKNLVFKKVSKSPCKVRPEMWFGGENDNVDC